jgi:4-carboxymuconolactone decarboxylase
VTVAPRLEPVEDPTPEQEALLQPFAEFSGGELFNIFRTLVRNPRLFKRSMSLGTALLIQGTLPPQLREMVILRVAWRTGSVYEWGQHVRIGQASGLDRDEIVRLATESAGDGWSDEERAAIAVADELCADDDLSDATWAAASGHWDDAELIELILLVGNYRMLAGFLNATRVELDPGLESFPFG